MTDHNSGAKDEAEERGAAGAAAANVVPFPRAWYGSADELVPIGTEPHAHRSDSLADASAFWGGESTEPGSDSDLRTELPGVAPSAAEPDVTDWSGAEPEPPRDSHSGARVSPNDVAARRVPAGGGDTRSASGKRLRAALATILCGVVSGLVALVLLGHFTTPKREDGTAQVAKPSLTVTRTIPQTTTVVRTVTTSNRSPARHRHTRAGKPRRRVRTRPPAAAPTPVSHSAATTVPAQTAPVVPAPATSTRSNFPSAVRGATPPTAGSTKPGCAPSATNGGACSL